MKLLLFSLILTLVFGACSSTQNLPNDVVLSETKANHSQKDYHKILIGATGSNSARLFVENLFEKLYEDFQQVGVQARYFYFGSDRQIFDSTFNKTITNEDFDARLFFFQKELPGVVEKKGGRNNAQRGEIGRNQLLEIKLFDSSDLQNLIWQANIKVNIDPVGDKIYSNISSLIFERLKENKIVK